MAKSLHKKALIIFGITIICVILALYGVSQILLLNSFNELEEQRIHQDIERVTNVLSHEFSAMDTIAYDWAAWDDTYAFIEDRNEQYIESNLIDETFTGLNLNVMLFINSSDQIVFGKAFDLEHEEEIPIPQSLLDHLAPNAALLRHATTESTITGILLLPEDPLIIVSRPILTSSDEGPIRGTMIMARYLDDAEIARFAGLTDLSLSVHRFSEPTSSSDLQTAKSFLSEQTPTFIQPLSEESIAGYALLEDIYGNPALVLKVDTPRSIYGQGQATLRYLILSILAVALAFSVVIMLASNRLVLSPLSKLNDNVNDIGKSGDPSRRVPVTGRDEFANLASAINETLASMEEFQSELRTSERKYRVLVENANEAIIVIQDGQLKYANPKAVEISGYSKEELTSRPFVDFIHPDNQQMVVERHFKRLQGEERPPVYSFRLIDKAGNSIWVEVNAVLIDWEGRPATLNFLSDITERKRAEEEINKLYQMTHDILEKAPFGIFVIDGEGTVEYVNPVMEVISGDTKEQLKHMNVLELPTYQKLGLADKIKSALMGESFFMGSVEYTSHYAKKRSIRNFAGMPFTDEEGRKKALVFVDDITDLKKTENALRESEEKYRTMIEHTGTGMCIIEEDTTISFVNNEYERITGYTKEEVEGKVSWTEQVIKEDLAVMQERHEQRRVDSSKLPSVYEFRLVTKRGDIRDILLHINMIPRTKKSLASLIDITERKHMEKELRESEEEYRSLVESTEDSVYLVDRNCRYLFMNQRHLSRLGLSNGDIADRTYSEFHSEATTKQFAEEVDEIFETWNSTQYEHKSHRDGRYFLRTLSPVKNPDGRTIAVTVISKDITELKRVENERKRFIKELEAKNAELERFTFTVSHDLASPLFAIRGFTTLAREDLEQGNTEDLANDFDRIEYAAAKMDLLLKDTLELSRIGRVANPPEGVPFGEIVEEALEQTVERRESNRVEVSVAKAFPTVHVDRMRIVEMLVNLIENSIKYRGDQPASTIEIGYRLDGKETVFFVKDNGIGIDPRQHERVLDLFYKVDSKSTGTGAGLAIVKRIIEVHGGHIWIESEKGKGCTVCFTLPVH